MAYAITALSTVTGALKLLHVIGEGETPNSDLSTDGLSRLNELVDWLGTQRLSTFTLARTTFAYSASTGTYSIGPSGAINQVRPDQIAGAAYIPAGSTQEILLTPISAEGYAGLTLKDQTAAAPWGFYYSPSSPLGSLVLYPTPTEAATLVLYVRALLEAFADLTTSYTLPAGYARMLRYQLAKQWAGEFGKALSPADDEIARESLADIKRKNITIPAASIDSAISGFGGYYDIWTGETFPG